MTSAVEAVTNALAEIERTEPLVKAWVHVDAAAAREQATGIDQHTSANQPLAGLTVGIKDIIDVAGMPTVAGFTPFADRIATSDADVVQRLRTAGAVIIGKTTTTQFALADPTPTRNPWNLDYSPAGSSSGSAAAVAAGHVDLALGSQTAGSTLRPASFCGIVGFKPTFGWASRTGMIPLADSLDTVGLFARDVMSIARLFDALADPDVERAGEIEPAAPPRIGFWEDAASLATDEVHNLVDAALARAIQSGVSVEPVTSPADYRDLLAIHHVIMLVDAAAAHEKLFQTHVNAYGPRIRMAIETGSAIAAHTYARAQLLRREYRDQAVRDWSRVDVVALPTAETPAVPLDTTGSPALQAVVTMFGLPSISIPAGLSQDGLPVGLQLVATSPNGNASLLRVAAWFERLLDDLPTPPTAIR